MQLHSMKMMAPNSLLETYGWTIYNEYFLIFHHFASLSLKPYFPFLKTVLISKLFSWGNFLNSSKTFFFVFFFKKNLPELNTEILLKKIKAVALELALDWNWTQVEDNVYVSLVKM